MAPAGADGFAKGARNFEKIHPVLDDHGSMICTHPDVHDAISTSAPAYAIPIISAEEDGALRIVTVELTSRSSILLG